MNTSFLLILPLATGLATLLVKHQAVRYLALGVSLVNLLITALLWQSFNPDVAAGIQFAESYSWIAALNINYSVGIDGISLLLVALTNFLTPIILLSSFRKEVKQPNLFYGLILIMQAALIGVFVARDAFLFYIFWELALIPIYFICLLWGGENKNRITFKFFIYTLVGSLIMLLGIIFLYKKAGAFDIEAFKTLSLSEGEQTFLFWTFFAAFAIKMPIFPLHTWQPDTYVTAPTQGTMLLSGIMLKMGIYGVIRWMLPVIPLGCAQWGTLAVILSIIGILYASIIALKQQDFKRMIAYVSIAHVGLIGAGVFSGTLEGLQGSMIQMLAHGINVVGLFFIVDIIEARTQTRDLNQLGGLRNQVPVFNVLFIIVLLASVALPLTSGFVGEFMLIAGVFKFNVYLAAIAGLTIILGAVYMLGSFQKIMLGEPKAAFQGIKDVSLTEFLVFAPIVALTFFMGVYPKFFLQVCEPAIKQILNIQ